MSDQLPWQYDEFKQVGTDYSLQEEVEEYDSRHSDFRDIKKESNTVLDSLGVGKSDILIDFGAGTGTFAIQAALRIGKVYAVDVSKAMLDHASVKAKREGVSNIEYCHGGFLTYELGGELADHIVTTFSFHHLPDFWKGVALRRMYHMLKPSGNLYIHDVILDETEPLESISALIEKLSAAGGDMLREDTEKHFREEYSTYEWVMDGLLKRSNFTIESKEIQDGVLGTYYCAKKE